MENRTNSVPGRGTHKSQDPEERKGGWGGLQRSEAGGAIMRDRKRFEEPEPLRPRNSFKQGSDKSTDS